jgi:hypothetical protein
MNCKGLGRMLHRPHLKYSPGNQDNMKDASYDCQCFDGIRAGYFLNKIQKNYRVS